MHHLIFLKVWFFCTTRWPSLKLEGSPYPPPPRFWMKLKWPLLDEAASDRVREFNGLKISYFRFRVFLLTYKCTWKIRKSRNRFRGFRVFWEIQSCPYGQKKRLFVNISAENYQYLSILVMLLQKIKYWFKASAFVSIQYHKRRSLISTFVVQYQIFLKVRSNKVTYSPNLKIPPFFIQCFISRSLHLCWDNETTQTFNITDTKAMNDHWPHEQLQLLWK